MAKVSYGLLKRISSFRGTFKVLRKISKNILSNGVEAFSTSEKKALETLGVVGGLQHTLPGKIYRISGSLGQLLFWQDPYAAPPPP